MKRKTQKGDIYALIEVNDIYGNLEIVFDEFSLDKFYDIYEKNSLYVFDVEIRFDNNFGYRLIQKRTTQFNEMVSKHNLDVEFNITDLESLKPIKQKLNSQDKGNSNIMLNVTNNNRIISLNLNKKVLLNRDIINEFFQISGVNAINFN